MIFEDRDALGAQRGGDGTRGFEHVDRTSEFGIDRLIFKNERADLIERLDLAPKRAEGCRVRRVRVNDSARVRPRFMNR